MFSKLKFIIFIAIITGALATFGVYQYLQKQKEKIQNPKFPLQKVVVAKVYLPIGKRLNESDLKVSDWPVNIVPKGCFLNITDAIDRVVRIEVFEGEAIIQSKLAPMGSEGGFSSIIPQGMRALTVSVNTYSGVSGFILPNTRVDVLVTVPSPNKKEESTTKIILENVKVLAVDQTFEREGDDPVIVQSVTMLVTPDEAEKLVLASTEGKLQLSLRNTADSSVKATSGVKLKELISKPRPRRVYSRQAPSKKQIPSELETEQRVIEVIRSNERTEVKVKEEKKSNEEKKSDESLSKILSTGKTSSSLKRR